MRRLMWLAPVLLGIGCSDAGDDSASEESDTDTDTDTDTDSDTDADSDTDTDTDADAAAWKGEYELPADGITILGERASDGVGLAFSVGDFDGDGARDVAAPAAFRADGGDSEVGQMAVALGPFSADVDLHDAWLTIAGEGQQAAFGSSTVAIPDLDGDGADELLVAAPGIGGPSSPTAPASVYLFEDLAPGELTLSEADVTYVGETDHDALGKAMAVADLDQDGTADLVLGAPFWELHNSACGAVYGIDGTAPDTQPEDAPLRIYGDYGSVGGYFGVNVTALGDIDGDGADDLAIAGGPGISIFHGPLSGAMLASDGDTTIDLVTYEVPQGSIAPAGDVDGDGVIDLLVGWYYEGAGPGAAWLFDGTLLDSGETARVLADWKLEGVSNQMLGYQVAGAGDVDGDDYADLLVSAPDDAEWGAQAGAVFFFRGPLSGTDESADQDASFHGESGTIAGKSMVPAVDITGDGRRDVLFGAPGIEVWKGGIWIVPGLAP